MEKVHYISGYISEQTTESLQAVLNGLTSEDTLKLIINSGGGYITEGWAMYDLLKMSEAKIETIGVGIVGSAATVIFLAGEKRELTEKATFFIHNPYVDMVGGDSDTLISIAESLKMEETRLLEIYNAVLTEKLESIPTKEYTAEEAVSMGFATGIYGEVLNFTPVQYKIVAQFKTEDKMNQKAMSILERIEAALFHRKQAASRTLDDGTVIYFEGEILAVDTAVFIDEALETPAPNGEHQLGDEILVVENGIVIEIKPVVEEAAEDVEALKAENETLRALLAEAQTEIKALQERKVVAAAKPTKKAQVAEEKQTVKRNWINFKSE